MSDPLSNLEIQDVLSSIRRLVSEDRNARENRSDDRPAEAAPADKLLLTEAHRVEDAGGPDGHPAQDEWLADEIPDAGGHDALDVAGQKAIRPASVLEDDLASLESTIAELEAAVAGIGDFEPDGSEVAGRSDDPENRALEDAFDNGFAVDTGGPGRFDPDDLSLDQPVAGDALAMTSPQPWAVPEEPDGEGGASDLPPEQDEIAFVRHDVSPRRADLHLVSGSEGILAAAGIRPGRLHLAQVNRVSDEDDGPAHHAVEGTGAGDASAGAAEPAGLSETAAPDTGTDADGAAEDTDRLAEPRAEAVQDAGVADAAAAEEIAPLAVAEEMVEAKESASSAVGDSAAEAEERPMEEVTDPSDAAAIFPADAAEPPSDGEDDDLGLFSADEEAVIDMDMLRDLIAEVIREELQGPLGERITRNVRKLVRQEIARALEAQKFD